jgi:hypothetical protein
MDKTDDDEDLAVDVDCRDCPAPPPTSYPIAYALYKCRGMPEATNAGAGERGGKHMCAMAASSTAAATAVMTRRRGKGRCIPATHLQVSHTSYQRHLPLTAPYSYLAALGRLVYATRSPTPPTVIWL